MLDPGFRGTPLPSTHIAHRFELTDLHGASDFGSPAPDGREA